MVAGLREVCSGLRAVAAPWRDSPACPLEIPIGGTAGSVTVGAGSYLFLGFLFTTSWRAVAGSLGRFGGWILAAVIVAMSTYLLYKYYERRRFLKNLRVSRHLPEELMFMLENASLIPIVDLRHRLEVEYDAVRIPGALSITLEEIEARKDEIPHDREVILYCS